MELQWFYEGSRLPSTLSGARISGSTIVLADFFVETRADTYANAEQWNWNKIGNYDWLYNKVTVIWIRKWNSTRWSISQDRNYKQGGKNTALQYFVHFIFSRGVSAELLKIGQLRTAKIRVVLRKLRHLYLLCSKFVFHFIYLHLKLNAVPRKNSARFRKSNLFDR